MKSRKQAKTILALAAAAMAGWGIGGGQAVASDPPDGPSLPKLLGNRFLTFTSVIRVRQIETTRDSAEGPDESSIHSPATAQAFRDMIESSWPGARITWAFSWLALKDQRPDYRTLRELVVSFHQKYGDEITFIPGGYFANMYSPREQVNRDLHDALKMVSDMVGNGYRPRSVIAGFLAAENLRYLAENEGIHVCQGNIWSQHGIDNGDGDGSISYPYYPSREHFLKPAQGQADLIDCVNLDGWTCDFLTARRAGQTGGFKSRLGVGPIETVISYGTEKGVQEMMATTAAHFDEGFKLNRFGWVTSICELGLVEAHTIYGYKNRDVVLPGLASWFKGIRSRWPDAKAVTVGEFGSAWREQFKNNDSIDYRFVQRGSGLPGSEPNMEIRWFMNKDFRLALLRDWQADSPEQVIDFTRYDLKAQEPPDPQPGAHARNWSLMNRLNQKGLRPEDKPVPMTKLSVEDQAMITRRYPYLAKTPGEIQRGAIGGYLMVGVNGVPKTYDAGFSMYVAAWPLVKQYPGNEFQTGLYGTWMHAHYDDVPKPDRSMYSDIEGGLDWWRDTQYATETPKFIMGGVALDFCAWANGPGAGQGRDWDQPKGKYGVAQLSPWVLWPPDGLNLKQGTCGELFGYGYLPLPLIKAKATTAGKNVPTGGNCWTLFLNTGNFKGPVAFFTPYLFSRITVDHPELAGMFLDTRLVNPNRPLSMETQHIPSAQGADTKGDVYARIAPTSFPRGAQDASPVMHRITAYNKSALWDAVEAWWAGKGPPVGGAINPKGAIVHTFNGNGGSSWKICPANTPQDQQMPLDWNSIATPAALDPHTFGYRWKNPLVTRTHTQDGPLMTLPEYYRLVKKADGKPQWVAVPATDVPAETGLAKVSFAPADHKPMPPYVTPDDPQSCWKKPGPVAGPFKATLGDGSTVTYYWYRFADQPALLNADLTDVEREDLQQRVVQLHQHWTKDREYLAPPTIGKLADIDPALMVTPPKGLEVGYVPIATRQATHAEN